MNTAAIITSCSVLFTALVAGVIAIIREIRSVHRIVNQQRTDAARYTAVLVTALRRAGVEVPDDQSLTDDAPPG